jgi:catechol 2,3-dioxygenase-like lactoylglutathione lyase family enzyme
VNPKIKALGEIVLRVKDLEPVKKFYTDVIGLDVLREFDGITFLRVAAGHGGHTQARMSPPAWRFEGNVLIEAGMLEGLAVSVREFVGTG